MEVAHDYLDKQGRSISVTFKVQLRKLYSRVLFTGNKVFVQYPSMKTFFEHS